VHDALPVRVVERAKHLADEPDGLADRELALARDPIAQRAPAPTSGITQKGTSRPSASTASPKSSSGTMCGCAKADAIAISRRKRPDPVT